MAVLIINLGGADGSEPEGRYLKDYDPDWVPPGTRDPPPMSGLVIWTDDKAEAKRFPDAIAVFTEWKRQSRRVPIRPWDGQPNRPLTAYTITTETVED